MFLVFTFRVTKIARRHSGVKVTLEDGKSLVADAAVIAVPLGVLKSNSIEFEPRLPDWKEEAIRDIGVGIENKIVLHFDKVFWPNVEFLGIVAETTYECSYFLNLHKATGHRVLVYMPSGQLARDIEKMSDEAAAKFAFTQLQKMLPNASEPVCLAHLILHLCLLFPEKLLFFNFLCLNTRLYVFSILHILQRFYSTVSSDSDELSFLYKSCRCSTSFPIGAQTQTRWAPTATIQ